MRITRSRAAVSLLGALGCAVAAAALAACFDLFHSTTDVLSACELDARAPGCLADAGVAATIPDAGTDFCRQWTSAVAHQKAEYGCAWLGACETPTGRNAFGPCMFQALLAYDCAANPNHLAQGKGHALWDCLWQVKTCGDVDRCVFPAGPQGCTPGETSATCGISGVDGGSNADVRVVCADGGRPSVENCALWGQTCAAYDAGTVCTGVAGLNAGPRCSSRACIPGSTGSLNEVEWCDDAGDQGIDCASNGAGRCDGFREASAPWVACIAAGDAGACSPKPSATCSPNGVASSCPSGVLETIDCAGLLQVQGACQAGPLDPPFDWTTPCAVAGASCTEACTDAGVVGCARGAAFSTSCMKQSLRPCSMVTMDAGQSPACTPPP